jgi:dTMP kinase
LTRRGLLISAEGLDRSGTGNLLELLARWLERRGRQVEIVQSVSSVTVRRAASSRRTRPFLDRRVAALLAAADFERETLATVERNLAKGSIVLVDRYVWTAIARNVARGLEPRWSRHLYRFARRPDLSIYLRQAPDRALRLILEAGPRDGALWAATGALRPFLRRIVDELEALTSETDDDLEAGPAATLVLQGASSMASNLQSARDAVRPLITARSRKQAARSGKARSIPATAATGRSNRAVPLESSALDLPGPAPGAHGEPGYLIVLEGIDHAGRSTHGDLLQHYLRERGQAAVQTSFGESNVAGDVIRKAKAERGWDPRAVALLYAADLAERIDHVIRPALRAGFVVIADRYAYTPVARAVARGVDQTWLEGLFSFVPGPDIVLLLDIPSSIAVARASEGEPKDSAGRGPVRLDEYERFQDLVSWWFVDAAARLGFSTVQADRETIAVQSALRTRIAELIEAQPVAVALP